MRTILLILITLLLGFGLDILPLPDWMNGIRPEWTVLIILYWTATLPAAMNWFYLTIGFLVGIFLDLLLGVWLGIHALALTIMLMVVIKTIQQTLFYSFMRQILMVMLFIGVYKFVLFFIQIILQYHVAFFLSYWLPVITSALLWPWVFALLDRVRFRE